MLPLVADVKHDLWLRLQQRLGALVGFRSNGHLRTRAKAHFEFVEPFVVYVCLVVFNLITLSFLVAEEHGCIIRVCVLDTCDAMLPATLDSSLSMTQCHMVLFKTIVIVKVGTDL